jgi:hypothetical protein
MKTTWLFIAGLASVFLTGQAASAQTVSPVVISPVQVAVSGPLSHGTDDGNGNRKEQHKFHPIPRHGGGPGRDDVHQADEGLLLNTDVGTNFPGVGANGFAPPDTNMAVGPNHIMQTVNSRYAIYDKNGILLAGPFALSSLWSAFGSGNNCAVSNNGDVVAQYDKLADRFIVTQLGSTTAPFSECIAVSQTSDPTGAYWLYSYSFGTQLNDYPKFGVWPTATNSAYLATYNLFANAQTFTGAALCAYDRAKMLVGDPTAQSICYTVDNDGGYLPADLDGSNPPLDGTPAYFLNYESTSSLRMYSLSPNFSNPGASVLSVGSPDIPVASFSEACAPSGTCIPQQGTSNKLDAVGDRMMYRLAFRNFGDHEAMMVNHSVAVSSRVGVRWYELRSPVSTSGSFSLYQQGTFSPDATYRWMGSAAMDMSGNIALGYSASSSTIHPAIRYTGRVPSDPLGTMESEVTLVAGTGSQTGGLTRWGDYTAMRVDPSDDCTFWYTNEYLVSNGSFNWQTAFGSFKFTTCHPPEISITANPSSLTVSQGASQNTTLTVTALNGFSGNVDLTVTGCPANATCTVDTPVNPSPTAASILTVSTATTTSIGNYFLTISGSTGDSVITSSVFLTVNPPPDFSISANPSSMTLVQVGTGTSSVTVTALYGFNGNVDLAVTGCPTGATCSISTPVTPNPTAASTLTVTLTTSTAAGTYMLTITGTHGALVHTANVPMTVTAAGTLTNVALSANGSVAVASTSSSGFSPANANDGDRKGLVYWNDATSNSFPDWLEVDFNGTKILREIDVFTVQDNFQSPADPTPAMTFTLYGLRNFEVQYWTGAAWAPIPGGTVTNNNLVWRKFTFSALSTSKIRVMVTATADGVWSRITEIEAYANISTFPDFSISADPTSLTLLQGDSGTSSVTVTALNGFTGSVGLALTGCPTGATCTLLPGTVTPGPNATSMLSISTSSSTSTGTFPLTITGTQAAVVHTATVSLTVNPPGLLTNVALPANGGTALASSAYNSALGAANTIDGDHKGLVYWNDATPRTFPDWLEVDFNGPKTLSEVDVFSVQDNFQSPVEPTPTMTFTLYGLRDFEVQYWTGSAWAPIPGGTVTNNNLVWRKITFIALSTSKIRVSVSATADGVWSRIEEVEAYASTSPDFSVSAGPSPSTVGQGGIATGTVIVTALNGFSASVDLAVTGCPTGATCTIDSPVIPSPTAASTLRVFTTSSTSTGPYTLTITGTQGALVHAATMTLTVNVPGTLTNVALPANGGVALASSFYSNAFATANAIDGDRKGIVYWNDATPRAFPDWLEVDFNGMKTISEVDVFTVQDSFQSPIEPTPAMTFSLYGLRNFEVQYWTGTAWADVPGGAVTNNSFVWRQFVFAPLATTKIRVLVTTVADGVWSRITELEAYTKD